MDYPNKTDLIAAAIYGLVASNTDLREEGDLPLWSEAKIEDRKACLDAAGFLLAYTFGADIRTVSADKVSEAFGKWVPKGSPLGYAGPEGVTVLFLNLSSLLK